MGLRGSGWIEGEGALEAGSRVMTGECRSGSTSSVAECDVYGGWAVPLHDGWLGADGAPGGRQA